jgi:phosphatidylserine/phosphatidylglycerophosphate/cardiolipin synthase-like enzyme
VLELLLEPLPHKLVAFALLVAASAQGVGFSPEERLDAIDAALIAGAKRTIDFAAYSLTDGAVLNALNAAERRGVAIRIVLDPRERHDFAKLGDAATAVIKSIYQNVTHDIDLQAD